MNKTEVAVSDVSGFGSSTRLSVPTCSWSIINISVGGCSVGCCEIEILKSILNYLWKLIDLTRNKIKGIFTNYLNIKISLKLIFIQIFEKKYMSMRVDWDKVYNKKVVIQKIQL